VMDVGVNDLFRVPAKSDDKLPRPVPLKIVQEEAIACTPEGSGFLSSRNRSDLFSAPTVAMARGWKAFQHASATP
jgi:hypothetical protein